MPKRQKPKGFGNYQKPSVKSKSFINISNSFRESYQDQQRDVLYNLQSKINESYSSGFLVASKKYLNEL